MYVQVLHPARATPPSEPHSACQVGTVNSRLFVFPPWSCSMWASSATGKFPRRAPFFFFFFFIFHFHVAKKGVVGIARQDATVTKIRTSQASRPRSSTSPSSA